MTSPVPDNELIERLLSYAPYFYQGKPRVPKVCRDAASRITELTAILAEVRQYIAWQAHGRDPSKGNAIVAKIDAALSTPLEGGVSTVTSDGRYPSGRATHERSRVAPSPPTVGIPNAETLIRLMSAWSCQPAHKFHKAYPFFETDRQRVIVEYALMNDQRANLEATALLFAEYADAIYDTLPPKGPAV